MVLQEVTKFRVICDKLWIARQLRIGGELLFDLRMIVEKPVERAHFLAGNLLAAHETHFVMDEKTRMSGERLADSRVGREKTGQLFV